MGTAFDARITIGFADGNENVLTGWTGSKSVNVPIWDITISGDGKNVTAQLKIRFAGGGRISIGTSYSTKKELKLLLENKNKR